MTISTTPSIVAGKLTEAQRNALLCGLRGYFDPNTIRALRRRGLIDGGPSITPLGIEVRALLHKEEGRGG